MTDATIYLKSGAVIKMKCNTMRTERNSSGELVRLEWENAKPKILYIRLADVSMITENV